MKNIFNRYSGICMREKRYTEIDVEEDFINTCISISEVNIWYIFDIDILESMFIEWKNDICYFISKVNIWCIFVVDILRLILLKWENDICCFILEVNIWYIFIIDILRSMLLEWKKKSCSIEFMLETCNYENLVKDNQNENWI